MVQPSSAATSAGLSCRRRPFRNQNTVRMPDGLEEHRDGLVTDLLEVSPWPLVFTPDRVQYH